MPRPTLPPTPASSTDLKGRDGSAFVASQMSFELPPPALTSDSRTSSIDASSSSASSYHPHSPISQPTPTKASRATAARKRTSSQTAPPKPLEPFALPPPPTRTRKIIQMKPSATPAVDPSPTDQAAKAAPGGKRKPPSATSAAGRKIARKTAHSLIERRRRSKMNEEFGVLKDMIPACTGEMHKLAILQASIEYIRYLEDCVGQLKAQNGRSTPTGSHVPREFTPHTYAHSASEASESDTDTEMSAPPPRPSPPIFRATEFGAPSQHQQQQHQPSQSPALSAQLSDQRHFSFSHSASTSPAFGPQTYHNQWPGSASSSTLTSPALVPQADQESTATVALMMLNGDWRMEEQRGTAERRGRGMSVRDLLSA